LPRQRLSPLRRRVRRTTCAQFFLGGAVGGLHEAIQFWNNTFEKDDYVYNILKHGVKIPVKMTAAEAATHYRERNNKSAREEMTYVRAEVARLVKDSQVVKMKIAPICTNPLSVAHKINADGSTKKRLCIDLSRWVNKFVVPDKYKMAQFEDALAQSTPGDYQSVYNISKAYHYIRLHPDSYELVGFCVEDADGKEHFYHFVVVVFGLGPAGQALGRNMRPILKYLMFMGVRNTVYVNNGRNMAASKKKADSD
jgi:hypothetical protein